jgi:hypothetical protein
MCERGQGEERRGDRRGRRGREGGERMGGEGRRENAIGDEQHDEPLSELVSPTCVNRREEGRRGKGRGYVGCAVGATLARPTGTTGAGGRNGTAPGVLEGMPLGSAGSRARVWTATTTTSSADGGRAGRGSRRAAVGARGQKLGVAYGVVLHRGTQSNALARRAAPVA